jgi:ferredoxin
MTGGREKVLTLFFSATGNTEYIARLFSDQMGAECLSIEDDADFTVAIKNHEVIAFCYPIYASRVPRIMREFVAKYMSEISGKKIVILVTQVLFSGDGARVFTDMFPEDTIEVIYAEHIKMPNNVNNLPFWGQASEKAIQRVFSNAEAHVVRICEDIKSGMVRKRGFSRLSKVLGRIQGNIWYGNSKKTAPRTISGENKSKNGVKIHKECTACSLCVNICPMKNFSSEQGRIVPKGNCNVCYRCVNRCPNKAVTVMFLHIRPKWQYEIAKYRRIQEAD